MASIILVCTHCKKPFFRDLRHINENKKLKQQPYCSLHCLGNSRKTWVQRSCSNPNCKKVFKRAQREILPNNYCSRSCATTINNTKFPKYRKVHKVCVVCQKAFVGRKKYCSFICKIKDQTISSEVLIESLKNFYQEHGRIPFKREFQSARAARERFGTWNKAIEAAGFKPNPVMFAKKHIAKDGHKCDSLAEKIIDDWLYNHGINHKRSIAYPGNPALTVDFIIEDYWVEFFGLVGEHRRYDELRGKKLQLVKIHKLKFIEIYPHHLFPKNKLPELFFMI